MTTLPEPESHLLDHNCPYSPHTTVLVAHSSDDKIGCGVIESTAGEIVQLAKYPNNTVKNVSGTLLVTQTTNGIAIKGQLAGECRCQCACTQMDLFLSDCRLVRVCKRVVVKEQLCVCECIVVPPYERQH